MKKLIVTHIWILFTFMAIAQEENRPKVVLGGAINYLYQRNAYPLAFIRVGDHHGGRYSTSGHEASYSTLSSGTHVGMELSENWMLGLFIEYTESVQKGRGEDDNSKITSEGLQFSVFSRYYLNPKDKLVGFLRPFANYKTISQRYSENFSNRDIEADYMEIGMDVGVLYRLNDNLRVQGRIGGVSYINGGWNWEDEDIRKEFEAFGLNMYLYTLRLGVEYAW